LDDLLYLCLGKQDIFGEAMEPLVVRIHIEFSRQQFRFAKGMLDLFCMAFNHHSMSSTL